MMNTRKPKRKIEMRKKTNLLLALKTKKGHITGTSQKDISEKLGISASAVSQRLKILLEVDIKNDEDK